MKSAIRVIVCVLNLITLSLSAQTRHDKILIVSSGGGYSAFLNKAQVSSYYSGKVDSLPTIPSDLSGYDALLLVLSKNNGQPLLDSTASLRLVDYVRHRGRLYAEANGFLTFDPRDSLRHPEDSVWHFVGLGFEAEDEVFDYYDSIIGVDSEFTNGLNVPQPRLASFQPSTYYPGGSIVKVLHGYESSFGGFSGSDDIFAWRSADTSIHAVMHHPMYAANEYYSAFLHRVLCNYFGLCEPVIVPKRGVNLDQPNEFIPKTNEEVYNILGVKVAENKGASFLPSGQYFVKVTNGKRTTIRPVLIQN